jgi:SAM-dependent methyltransferase
VLLADGSPRDLAGLSREELVRLQWEQESAFARRILAAPKRSAERAAAVAQAYDTVTRIFAGVVGTSGKPLVMGLHPRYERMLRRLVDAQRRRGVAPRFFEIGYASGVLLERVRSWGVPVAGVEVSRVMHDEARRHLGPDHAGELYVGDLLGDALLEARGRYTLVYWNDVFEHLPPDEIRDYLRRIHALLAPGGQLVTITPNWHMRPSDVTAAFHPARTEAAGLHLKEYTLGQVVSLLREAGFARVATPLFNTRSRSILWGGGLLRLKCLMEPCLELLPPRLVRILCHGIGLSATIATKP